ncbi:O-antigen ligase family protein [Capnocytophaga cynodegmi]|uniref:O-antigen ligase family protein n=1 Tax=Capnocytophaga cynodegmi TaxID=28189 RepID=UPI00385E6E7C
MKSKNKKSNTEKESKATISGISSPKQNTSMNLLTTILLIAYGYVTVLTPNWLAFDSNAPKFYTFAILNLITAVLLFFIKDFREKSQILFGFFTNKIGIAYSVIILFSVLSFTKVINVEEAVLHFFKVFTAFSAAWMVSALVIYNPKAVTSLAVAMTILLFYDSLKTFEGVSKIIKGTGSDVDIKSSYSNKNILSSAIFIKIPFAIWLFYFKKKTLRIFGGIGIVIGTLSVFFMSTRAFYIATFIVLFVLGVYALLNYFLLKRKRTATNVGTHALFVVLAFGVFSFVQGVMYPKAVRENTSFTARLATIADEENISNNLRKTAWTTTITEMIPNDPILGVGIGNWKVRYLEYENSHSPHYIYMYKVHNDFLELTSETGIISGLAFLSIFLLMAYYFLRATYKNKNEEQEKWLFLPLLGLFSYSFDAFFNFPQDRPEIQSLFAIYVGLGVAFAVIYFSRNGVREFTKLSLPVIGIVAVVTIVLDFANVLVEKMYFDSSKIQRMVKEEQQGIRKAKSPSTYLVQNYPKIPNLTAVAEPVDVEKARYLIDEKKFAEAREILSSINYHPWDGRKEYFIAVSYFMEENKKFDSIYKYANKARKIKPNFFGNTNLEAYALNNMGREKESIELWKEFLNLNTSHKEQPKWKQILKESLHVDVDIDSQRARRKEAQAWNALAYLQEKNNLIEEAKATLDTAFVYLPNDKTIADNRSKITSRFNIQEFTPIFNSAIQFYQQKDYVKAITEFTNFLDKVPAHNEALRLRGISYYYTQQYQNAIKDFSRMEELGTPANALINNFQASCYYMLGDKLKAKELFQKAANEGNTDAQKNLQNLTF